MAEERARLRPLKVAPEELALRFPVMVGPTAMVMHEGRTYSMPPEAIGIAGTLYLYRERVRIVAGRFEAEHARQFEPGARSMLPEHRAQARRRRLRTTRQALPRARASARTRARRALEYLTELTHRRPRLWVRDVHQLHELLAAPRRRRACAQPSSAASPSDCSAPSTSPTRCRCEPPPRASARPSRSSRCEARRHRPRSAAQAPASSPTPGASGASSSRAPRPSSGPSTTSSPPSSPRRSPSASRRASDGCRIGRSSRS